MSFMPLIERTVNIIINKTKSDANAKPTVKKNVFKMRLSLDLKAITIEKSIIEINIINSTITKITKRISESVSETGSVTMLENKRVKIFFRFGPAYIIKIETTNIAKPASISIVAVKYFELMS